MMNQKNHSHGILVGKLLLVIVFMFVFAIFLLPPLYDVFCEVTGLNGKFGQSTRIRSDDFSQSLLESNATESVMKTERDPTRPWIRVQFMASVASGLPVSVTPSVPQLSIQPGDEMRQLNFNVVNHEAKAVALRAIPSVTPALSTEFLKKVECFCFQEQVMQPKQRVAMGLSFFIDPEIPENVSVVTLSYAFYPADIPVNDLVLDHNSIMFEQESWLTKVVVDTLNMNEFILIPL